jgi:hypothetical protein
MLPVHLALVSTVADIDFSELSKVSAALQKQIIRDFGPIWNIDATIDVFAIMEDVPLDYWRIIIVDTVEQGGQHRDRHHQPYALVGAGASWSLAASHEALEMLADPFGSRLIAGVSPDEKQKRVEFLVEVCDPCQDDDYAYTVNGILVSDFYTPNYFDPIPADGVRYSFNGSITGPRQVLPGGYLSWHDPESDRWFQEKYFSAQPEFVDLGELSAGTEGIRAMIDRVTPETRRLSKLDLKKRSMQLAAVARKSAESAASARAKELRLEIEEKKKLLDTTPDDGNHKISGKPRRSKK